VIQGIGIAQKTTLFLLAGGLGAWSQIRPVSGRQAEEITNLLRSAQTVAQVEAGSSVIGQCTESTVADGARVASQRIQASKAVYDPIAANSSASVLWPGSLVQLGPLVSRGELSGIPVARTGGTVFLSAIAATIDSATGRPVRVDAPITEFKAAAVETARIERLGNPQVIGTAQFTAGFATFNSLEELAFKLNGSVSAFGASFQAQLSSSRYRENNNEAILLYQPIYTYATEDLPGAAAFAEGVTAQSLAPYTDASNPIGYISSVTYGRMAVMTFSSTIDRQSLDELVKGSAGFLVGNVSVESERKLREAIRRTEVHLWVYGFPMASDSILGAADVPAALKTAMADAGPMVIRSALPLFYRVQKLYDNKGAAVNLVTEYPSSTRSGAPLVDSVKVHFRMGSDGGDNKDWNTGLSIYLLNRASNAVEALRVLQAAGSNALRALGVVPKGVNGEGSWQSGRDDIEVPLVIHGELKWSELNALSLLILEDASGSDHIGFTPTVIATGPGGTIYRSTPGAFSMPSGAIQVAGMNVFPGDFGQVSTVPPALPAPRCEAPENALANARAASRR
jgi:hypothetical protein